MTLHMTTAVSLDTPSSSGEYAPSALESIKTIKREGNLGWMMNIWRQHGDLTHVRVGSQSFFLVVHPEHVRRISVTHRQNYDKAQSYDVVRELLLGNGIVTATGDDWRGQRKLMAPFFRRSSGSIRPCRCTPGTPSSTT